MNDSLTQDQAAMEALLGRIADEFTERLNRGETPRIEEYALRHPQIAPILRQVLPSLQLMRAPDAPQKEDDSAAGSVKALGDFRIEREIGRGGMGIVYEATQLSLGRKVALKVLPFAATLDPRHLQRFQNEARAAASLEHPNIVPVYGVGCERGVHYYAMRFIEGQPLDHLLDKERQEKRADAKPTPNNETRAQASTLQSRGNNRGFFLGVARLALQAAEALEQAHQCGIIHRDIKPGNLLVDAQAHLWVADFGLAQIQSDTRVTMTGDLVGTLRYMSPEQALAKRVVIDHRTDIYSLGATFYEVLTLTPAFAGQDRQELLRQIAFEEPAPLRKLNRSIPVELEAIILKALEKNPQERYATAKDMAADLQRYLNDEPTLARRPNLWQRTRKWGRRHTAAVRATTVALILVLAVVGGAAGWILRDRSERQIETERAVHGALEEARRLQNDRKLPDALAKVKQAQAILAGGAGTTELVQRVQERLTDLMIIADLEEIRSHRADATDRDSFAAADRKYTNAFNALGVDVAALTLEEAAKRIRQRTVAIELAAALDDWSMIVKRATVKDETRRKRLIALAQAVDPDPLRTQVRDALEKNDGGALKILLAKVEGAELPPATAVAFAAVLEATDGKAEAVQLLQHARRRHVADFWINFHLALSFATSKSPNYDEAIRYFTAALTIRPTCAGAHFNLGVALQLKHRLDEALAAYREVIRLEPNNAGAYLGVSNVLRGKKEWGEAIAALKEAIRLKEARYVEQKFPVMHHELAWLYYEKGSFDDAIAASRRAVSMNPNYWQSYQLMGLAFRASGRPTDAVDPLRVAIQLAPDEADAYAALGQTLQDLGQLDESILRYREAIQLKPNDAGSYSKLARLLANSADQSLRNPPEALKLAEKAVELSPKSGGNWNTKGMALYRTADYAGALKAFSKAIELEGKGGNSRSFFWLAMTHWQLDDKVQARIWFYKGVQWMESNSPNNAEFQSYRAEAAALLGLTEASDKK
ncbi:MAG TPA: tetratricopeptide repeat protein [Gemmataceae bacterium]|nr:tetratricopeptide repeat protein [Gemmataceae bacterium]